MIEDKGGGTKAEASSYPVDIIFKSKTGEGLGGERFELEIKVFIISVSRRQGPKARLGYIFLNGL